MSRLPAFLFIVGRSSANPELNRNRKVRQISRNPALDPATTLENPDSAPRPRRPQLTAGLAPLAKQVPTANPDSALIESGRLLDKERIRPTLKMSHGGSGRASCRLRGCRTGLHSRISTLARGVTAPDVGSGAWLGRMSRLPDLPHTVGRSSGNRRLNCNLKVRPTSRCPTLDPATTLEYPDSAPRVRAIQGPDCFDPFTLCAPTANLDSGLMVNGCLQERSGYAQR
jgi:hypothetical protein